MMVRNSRNYSFLLLCAVLFLFSGCGFQPRVVSKVPTLVSKAFHLSGVAKPGLASTIERQILERGARRLVREEEIGFSIRIDGERLARRVLSVDSSGKAQEYLITYRLSFSLIAPDGETLLASRVIERQGDFLYDADNVLSMSDREQELKQRLGQEVVSLMLDQIAQRLAQGDTLGGH